MFKFHILWYVGQISLFINNITMVILFFNLFPEKRRFWSWAFWISGIIFMFLFLIRFTQICHQI